MPREYPNIYQYFSKDWIDKELRRDPESKHPLIIHMKLNDTPTLDFLNNLESCLKCLNKELKQFKGYENDLKQKFLSTFAEIEVATFFKKMGFMISMNPKLKSGNSGDILLHYQGYYIHIEVTRKEKPKERPLKNIPEEFSDLDISELPHVKPETYADKIDKESKQLSDDYPNILCIYLDPLLVGYNEKELRLAFYDGIIYSANGKPYGIVKGQSRYQIKKISAFFEFSNIYSNGYHLHNLMHLNPNSKHPIPDDIMMLFRQGGVNFADNPRIIPYYE